MCVVHFLFLLLLLLKKEKSICVILQCLVCLTKFGFISAQDLVLLKIEH